MWRRKGQTPYPVASFGSRYSTPRKIEKTPVLTRTLQPGPISLLSTRSRTTNWWIMATGIDSWGNGDGCPQMSPFVAPMWLDVRWRYVDRPVESQWAGPPNDQARDLALPLPLQPHLPGATRRFTRFLAHHRTSLSHPVRASWRDESAETHWWSVTLTQERLPFGKPTYRHSQRRLSRGPSLRRLLYNCESAERRPNPSNSTLCSNTIDRVQRL